MKKSTLFRGVATALVTPFDENTIDYTRLAGLVEYQLTGGVDALLVCGTTGESPTLSDFEQKELVAFAVAQARGRAPVIAGAGSNSTLRASSLAHSAAISGASAVLSVTPYYNKCGTKGLVAHYKSIADAVYPLPVIVYNVPSRTGMSITPEQYSLLAEIENVSAVKEAGSDVGSLAESIRLCGGALDFYTGNDELTLPALALGGEGVISVTSNILPREMKKMCACFLGGNLSASREIFFKLLPLMRSLFERVNPIPVKKKLAEMGMILPEMRLPLVIEE